jgi:hypothetical protein
MASGSTLHQLNLDNVSPATRLLEKRRQMFEVQEALETQKEEFARKEEMFKRREDGLRLKDLQLQEALIRFNKFLQVCVRVLARSRARVRARVCAVCHFNAFLQENDSKRGRAEKKVCAHAHACVCTRDYDFVAVGARRDQNTPPERG